MPKDTPKDTKGMEVSFKQAFPPGLPGSLSDLNMGAAIKALATASQQEIPHDLDLARAVIEKLYNYITILRHDENELKTRIADLERQYDVSHLQEINVIIAAFQKDLKQLMEKLAMRVHDIYNDFGEDIDESWGTMVAAVEWINKLTDEEIKALKSRDSEHFQSRDNIKAKISLCLEFFNLEEFPKSFRSKDGSEVLGMAEIIHNLISNKVHAPEEEPAVATSGQENLSKEDGSGDELFFCEAGSEACCSPAPVWSTESMNLLPRQRSCDFGGDDCGSAESENFEGELDPANLWKTDEEDHCYPPVYRPSSSSSEDTFESAFDSGKSPTVSFFERIMRERDNKTMKNREINMPKKFKGTLYLVRRVRDCVRRNSFNGHGNPKEVKVEEGDSIGLSPSGSLPNLYGNAFAVVSIDGKPYTTNHLLSNDGGRDSLIKS